MKQYFLDGKLFNDLSGFFNAFGQMINGEGGDFGKNMDSFDDCLFGGCGMENPCVLIWKHSALSKKSLGHAALFTWYEEQIERKTYLDEDGLKYLISGREQAKISLGPTLFDQIVDRIKTVEQRSFGKIKIELILD